jgi:hypothetical protein
MQGIANYSESIRIFTNDRNRKSHRELKAQAAAAGGGGGYPFYTFS